MKIVVLTAHFPPRFAGGTERVALAQARALSARGHQVIVISGTDDPHTGTCVEVATHGGLPVRFLPRTSDEPFDLELQRPRLTRLIAAEVAGADLVHVHGFATLTADLVREVARLAPVVVTLHDHFATCPRFFREPSDPGLACPPAGHFDACAACLAPDAPGVPAADLERGLRARHVAFQKEIDAASVVIVPSRTHLVRLAQHLEFAAGQVHILGHGLCLPLPAERRKPRAWNGKGPLRVLHAGRRSVDKGTLDLVRALAPLGPGKLGTPGTPGVELVLAGGPVDAAFDEELRRAAGDLALRIHGTYEGEQLARLAAKCHIAALPSRLLESYSLALDEAVALGLPAWVANGEAGCERFGSSAMRLMPAADPSAWSAAFAEVLADPGLSRADFEARPRSVPDATETVNALEEIFEGSRPAQRGA